MLSTIKTFQKYPIAFWAQTSLNVVCKFSYSPTSFSNFFFFWFRRILPLPHFLVHIIVKLQSLWLVQSRLVGRVVHSWSAPEKSIESFEPNLLNVVIYDNPIFQNTTASRLSFNSLQEKPNSNWSCWSPSLKFGILCIYKGFFVVLHISIRFYQYRHHSSHGPGKISTISNELHPSHLLANFDHNPDLT